MTVAGGTVEFLLEAGEQKTAVFQFGQIIGYRHLPDGLFRGHQFFLELDYQAVDD